MENRIQPSLLNRIVTPILFLLGGFSALFWFLYRIYKLIEGSADSVVLVDKGSYYMLGVGIGMLDLAFVIIWEQWLRKPLNNRVTTIFSRLAVASIILLLALPHTIHYFVGEHLRAKGYSVCEEASHQWLFVRDIVYIQESMECSKELKKK
ncbi:MAG: hypothetical protein GY799_28245 [Desulfobulbaceae bacterium]|nr:hypothetical protein [Desulfobulbaceae bacterium]